MALATEIAIEIALPATRTTCTGSDACSRPRHNQAAVHANGTTSGHEFPGETYWASVNPWSRKASRWSRKNAALTVDASTRPAITIRRVPESHVREHAPRQERTPP